MYHSCYDCNCTPHENQLEEERLAFLQQEEEEQEAPEPQMEQEHEDSNHATERSSTAKRIPCPEQSNDEVEVLDCSYTNTISSSPVKVFKGFNPSNDVQGGCCPSLDKLATIQKNLDKLTNNAEVIELNDSYESVVKENIAPAVDCKASTGENENMLNYSKEEATHIDQNTVSPGVVASASMSSITTNNQLMKPKTITVRKVGLKGEAQHEGIAKTSISHDSEIVREDKTQLLVSKSYNISPKKDEASKTKVLPECVILELCVKRDQKTTGLSVIHTILKYWSHDYSESARTCGYSKEGTSHRFVEDPQQQGFGYKPPILRCNHNATVCNVRTMYEQMGYIRQIQRRDGSYKYETDAFNLHYRYNRQMGDVVCQIREMDGDAVVCKTKETGDDGAVRQIKQAGDEGDVRQIKQAGDDGAVRQIKQAGDDGAVRQTKQVGSASVVHQTKEMGGVDVMYQSKESKKRPVICLDDSNDAPLPREKFGMKFKKTQQPSGILSTTSAAIATTTRTEHFEPLVSVVAEIPGTRETVNINDPSHKYSKPNFKLKSSNAVKKKGLKKYDEMLLPMKLSSPMQRTSNMMVSNSSSLSGMHENNYKSNVRKLSLPEMMAAEEKRGELELDLSSHVPGSTLLVSEARFRKLINMNIIGVMGLNNSSR